MYNSPNRIKKFWINPKRITLEHVWLAAPFFVIFVKGFRVQLPLLDFWWHLKMGEIIASTRSIPGTDLFSFTAAGKPFIVQNWLAELLYYRIYQLGGLPLMVFVNALLLAMALLPVFALCRESTHRSRLAAISTLLVCFSFAGNARPQIFSFVLFAFFYWILDGYRFHRRNRLWLLPPAIVLWVNLHGAFVVGIGLIGLFLGLEIIRHILRPAADDILSTGHLRKLAVVLVACLAATLANPTGYKVYEYIRVVMTDRASQQTVTEWQTPGFGSAMEVVFYGMIALSIVGFLFSRRRPNITDLALFLGFAAFGLTAFRNMIWFALIIAPILVRYWDEFRPDKYGKKFQWLHLHRAAPDLCETGVPAARQYNTFNFILLSIAVLIVVIMSPWVRPALYHVSLLDPHTPVKAIDYIEQHSIRGHIFHPQIFGDYLIWRLYPRQRSFFDGRVHLFGEAFVGEYLSTLQDPKWETKLARFDIQYLLLSKKKENCRDMISSARASRNWTVLFEDEVSILFGRSKDMGRFQAFATSTQDLRSD